MRLKHARAIRNYHLPPFTPRPGLSSGPFLLVGANRHPRAIRIPTVASSTASRTSRELEPSCPGIAGHAHSARIYVTCKPHRLPIVLPCSNQWPANLTNGEEKVRPSCVDKVGLTITISARSTSYCVRFSVLHYWRASERGAFRVGVGRERSTNMPHGALPV